MSGLSSSMAMLAGVIVTRVVLLHHVLLAVVECSHRHIAQDAIERPDQRLGFRLFQFCLHGTDQDCIQGLCLGLGSRCGSRSACSKSATFLFKSVSAIANSRATVAADVIRITL